MQPEQTVLVLDFGSQYTQLIARRIRDNGVFSVVHPFDYPLEKIRELAPKAIVLSGGPQSVYAEAAPICSRELFDLGIPILGICYGMQLTAYLLDRSAATDRDTGARRSSPAESPFSETPKRQQVREPRRRILNSGFTRTCQRRAARAFENRDGSTIIQFYPRAHTGAGA
jgi:GMP synthase-like glutamine amidotransferase